MGIDWGVPVQRKKRVEERKTSTGEGQGESQQNLENKSGGLA